MAIRQRGDSWQIDIAYKGSRVRHTVKGKMEAELLEKQVQIWLVQGHTTAAIKEQLEQGTGEAPTEAPKTTFRQLFTLACKVWDTQPRGGNQNNAKAILDYTKMWDVDVTTLISADFEQMLDDYSSAKGLSKATRNRYLHALSKMLTCGVDSGLLTRKPKMKVAKEGKGRIRFLTEHEEQRILAYWQAQDNMPMYHFTVFMLEMGLRNWEALNVSVEDIEDGVLTFWRRKTSEWAHLPLSSRAEESLRAVGKFNLGQRSINGKWQHMAEELRLKGVTPYVMRHTKCTRMVKAGVHILKIKKWMGHANISTTERYVHLDTDSLLDCVQESKCEVTSSSGSQISWRPSPGPTRGNGLSLGH